MRQGWWCRRRLFSFLLSYLLYFSPQPLLCFFTLSFFPSLCFVPLLPLWFCWLGNGDVGRLAMLLWRWRESTTVVPRWWGTILLLLCALTLGLFLFSSFFFFFGRASLILKNKLPLSVFYLSINPSCLSSQIVHPFSIFFSSSLSILFGFPLFFSPITIGLSLDLPHFLFQTKSSSSPLFWSPSQHSLLWYL